MRQPLLILIAACSLSGCAGAVGDPFARAGTWTIEHNNDTNLQAMVANPADLQRGHGDGTAIGETAVTAIDRLRAGKVRALPASGVAEITTVNSGSSGSGGAQ